MATLNLTLLGGFRARIDPGGPVALPTRKTQALLAFLALPAGRAHPRDKLVALLWGGVPESQGRASLRQAIFAIKRATDAASALLLGPDTIALAAGAVDVDAGRFAERVHEGTPAALEEAVGLYQGDLLSGLALREPPFEEWLLGERERLRELAMEALARLLAHRRDTGAVEEAIQAALRLVALDPLLEPVHRSLMRLYVQAGRRGAALRQYQSCVAALERELRTEPEAETKALYQEVLRERPAARPRPVEAGRAPEGFAPAPAAPEIASTEVPLVGREAEMARLDALLDRLHAGDGMVVGLEGEAGMGKSRMAAEVAARAQRRGGRVLLGRCYETEQILPYGPWLDAFRTAGIARDTALLEALGPVWRLELARVLPEAAAAEPPAGGGEPGRVFEAVAQLLERLAARQPLVVVLEDLQWADETSARLVAFLGRRLERRPVLLLTTVRAEDALAVPLLGRMRDELARAGRIAHVALAPLAREATVALARGLLAAGDRRGAEIDEQIWRASEGNPFMVVETLRALEAHAGAAGPGALPLPGRVRALIGRRLERLSERGRRLTETAAVIGRQFEFPLLCRAAGLPEDEAAAGAEELVRSHVLHQSGDGLEFLHDRIREVAYADLVGPRRAILHRRVAEAIETLHAGELDQHALAMGTHYRAAGVVDRAADFLVRAAVAALGRGAAREALACCEQALGGLVGQAAETGRRRGDLHLQAGHAHFWMGELERAMERYRRAEADARALGDGDRLARVAVALTRLLGADARYREALAEGERGLALATALGDRSLEVWARAGLCPAHFALGNYPRVVAHARATLEALPGTPLGERPAAAGVLPGVSALGWWAQCAAQTGDFEEGLIRGREALRVAEAERHQPACAFARYSLGHLLLARGRAAEAQAALEPAVDLALIPIRPRVLSALAVAHARAGRLDRAEALIEEAIETAAAARFLYGHSLTLIRRASVHLLAGRLDVASAALEEALAVTRERGQRGDEAWALFLAAEVAARRWVDGAAAGPWSQALALAEALGMRPLAARCRLSLGSAAVRQGDRAGGRAALDAAAAAFRDMGMTPWPEAAEPRG